METGLARLSRGAFALAGGLLVVALLLGPLSGWSRLIVFLLIAAIVCASAVYVAAHVHPAYMLSVALVLSIFSGNWGEFGIPGSLAPDRLLFLTGIAAVLFRAPPVRDRAPLRIGAVHWAMVITVLWFVGSSLAAGSLADRPHVFELAERLGVVPFLLFLVAPVAFEQARHRRVLLAALVVLGAYLAFTALMEALGIEQLVRPAYINDGSIGTHADRARGPFVEAVTNGTGLYLGGIAAALALVAWRQPRLRLFAGGVLVLSLAGLLFTETRSVWIAGIVATVVALLSVRELRRYAVPAIAAGIVVLGLSVALVPGLAEQITERRNDQRTVWDRKNLATAAVNMVEEQPLVGIGSGRFVHESAGYFRVAMDYPLTAEDQVIHHVFLTYAAEAGLIGLGLWCLTLALGMWAALRPGGRPEARPWKIATAAYLLFFVVIANFVFTQVFPSNALWLLAGVAVAAAGTRDVHAHA